MRLLNLGAVVFCSGGMVSAALAGDAGLALFCAVLAGANAHYVFK